MAMKRKRGRPPGPTAATEKLVEQVYRYRGQGLSVITIARKLGVTRGYVYHLINTYEIIEE